MSRVKIAYIGQRGVPPSYSGVERYVDEIVRRLPNDEVESYTYSRPEYSAEPANYTHRLFVPSLGTQGGLETFLHSFCCSLDSLRHPFDLVHFQALGPSLFSCIPKLRGTKIVATVHGMDWQRAKWGRAARTAIKSGDHMMTLTASAIISVSKRLKEHYESRSKADVFFVPIGVGDPKILAINEIHTRFGLEPNKYILFLSRLVPEKGIHHLIEAFKNIKRDDYKLVIAGGAPPGDSYVSNLKRSAATDKRIVFTDFVSQHEVHELYSNAFLFVLPSELEGMPAVVLEALSHKCAVLVSDIEENIDVISGNGQRYGFLHECGNVADLQKSMSHLMENPDVVERLRTPGYEYVRQYHSWDNAVNMTYDVYKHVMSR